MGKEIVKDDLVDKIVKFCEVTAGIKYYSYQRETTRRVVEALIHDEGEEITVLMARQVGKTESIASLLAGLSIILPLLGKQGFKECEDFQNGLMVGIFAPSHEQVFTTYSRAMGMLKAKRGKEIMADPEINEKLVKGSELKLLNGSYVKGQSGAKQSMIESKSYHLIIVEEAQDMDDTKVKKSIHPMLAAYNGTIIKIGTANKRRSDFYHAIMRNKARESVTGRKTHFQFDYLQVIKDKKKLYKETNKDFHLKYAKFIKSEKRRLGVLSDEFRMSYGVEFILERGMFITDLALQENYDKKHALHRENKDDDIVIGIDVGKSNASTIVTVMKVDLKNPDEFGNFEKRIINWYELKGSYDDQFYRLIDIFERYVNILKIGIDSTGVGDAFVDRMIGHFDDLYIEGVKFTTKSKSDMYKYLDVELKSHRLVIPYSIKTRNTRRFKRFETQMLGLEKEWKGAFMNVHKGNDKWDYDDYPDSLAICNWMAKDNIIFEVEKDDIDFKKSNKQRLTAYW